MTVPRLRSFLLAAVAALPVLFAGAAHAQGPGRRGFPDVTDPQIDSKELETYKSILNLSDDQFEAFQGLQQAYVAELAKLGERVREITDAAREEFRQTRDMTIWRDLRGVIEKFSDQRDAMTEAALSDMRLLLSPEQDADWTQVDQFRRRRHELVSGAMLSGEGVDLITLVEGVEIDDAHEAAVESLLTQYASDLDRAIIERDAARERMREAESAEDDGGPEFTQEMETRYFADIKKQSEAIRDLNRQYLRQVRAEIQGPAGDKLESSFQRASFPSVYAESSAEKAITAALHMNDIAADQADQLKAAQAAYERDRSAMNQRLADAIVKNEAEMSEPPRRGPGFGGRPGGGGGGPGGGFNDAQRELFQARRDLDLATIAKIRAILTPEQAEHLPESPSEDWRSRDFDAS